MLRHSTQRHTTLLHSQLIDDDGTWVRKIIIYKAHKCLLRSWTQDTHCQTGWRGATTHSSHELSSQSAQIPDLESDSDSDLDSASDALCQLRRGRWNYDNAGGCLAMMGRSWGEAGNSGGGVGVTIAACQLQRRRPRLALSARALAEFALELGLRWSCKCVCIWHMTLYIPQATSLSPFVPSPFSARPCSLSVCPSRRPIKY